MGDVRRLAAVMLTDMVGYTSLAQQDEGRALAALRELDQRLRPRFREFRGRVVKGLGDGYLVEFRSALDAVECALSIQVGEPRTANVDRGSSPRLRIGVHLGDVVHRSSDVFGDAVNIVSRIEPLSEPGGLAITGEVFDQVRNKVGIRFESIGTPALKHIETPIRVYRWVASTPARTPAAPPGPRVIVLPWANLSGRPEDDYLAEGITDELIQSLSKIPGLRVVGRASMMRFRGTEQAPSEIARELEAKAVVEGGIRKAGSRLRVTARLLDAASSETLWSEEYDRTSGSLFRLQSEIAGRIARSLAGEIVAPRARASERSAAVDPAAVTLYLQGRQQLNRRTGSSLREALERFQGAIDREPAFALGYVGVADGYSTLAWLELARPRFAMPRAREAARKALALDPSLPEAHTSLGFVRFLYDRAWVEAESEFRQAIAGNPNYPTAHQFYADYLKAMGRMDEALAEVRRALELDPLSLSIQTALGHVLYLRREYDAAIAQYRRALELDPGFVQAHLWFGRPYLEKGEYDRAIEEVRRAVEISGGSTISLAVLGHAYASAGNAAPARKILYELAERGRRQYVPSYWIALVHVGLGETDRAFQWIGRAERERSAWLAWVAVEPRFDRIRSDPRFAKLLRRLKLR